jgi:hypothetical protein
MAHQIPLEWPFQMMTGQPNRPTRVSTKLAASSFKDASPLAEPPSSVPRGDVVSVGRDRLRSR